jgi:hypothetical protein
MPTFSAKKYNMKKILNVKTLFGNQLEEIYREDGIYAKLTFEDRGDSIVKRKFAYVEQVEKNALFFIGLNPSGGDTHQDDHFYYKLEQTGGNGYPKFWQPFEDIASRTNLTWTHLDLLGIRETKQTNVRKILGTELGVNFVLQQLLIAKQIIEEAKPRIIVVCNTLSRFFLGYDMTVDKKHNVWMGYEFEFDEDLGTDRIVTKGDLFGTPIFFSSMLSGQRALDTGSEKRLVWHIKRVDDMLNENTKNL